MQPHIAMAIAHPATRSAISYAMNSAYSNFPDWAFDVINLEHLFWELAEQVITYAATQPLALVNLPTDTDELRKTVFTRLVAINGFLQEVNQRLQNDFAITPASAAYQETSFYILRIALISAVVVQCQGYNINPQQLLERL